LVEAANLTATDDEHWREVLSVVVFNGRPAELACLDELGNRFLAAGLVNAAHAWYVTLTILWQCSHADPLSSDLAICSPRLLLSPILHQLLSIGQSLSLRILETMTP